MTKRRSGRLFQLLKNRKRRAKQRGEAQRGLLLERLDARILLDAAGLANEESPDGLWQLLDAVPAADNNQQSLLHTDEYAPLAWDDAALMQALANAPLEFKTPSRSLYINNLGSSSFRPGGSASLVVIRMTVFLKSISRPSPSLMNPLSNT